MDLAYMEEGRKGEKCAEGKGQKGGGQKEAKEGDA